MGRSKSFAIRYDAQMIQAKFFMFLFNMNALNSNTYVTSDKMLFDISQIEFLLRALQVQLKRPV